MLSHPSFVRFVKPMFSLYPYYSSQFYLYSPQSQITMCQCASLHSHCFFFFCVIYTRLVRADKLSVFLAYWLLWPLRLFFTPSLLCPCQAELVIERIDWLAVAPIDSQGQTAGYWQMALQFPPSFYRPPLLLTSFIHLYPPLLNLSLTSFHLQPPLSPSTVCIRPPILLSTLLSPSLFWVCRRYRSSMQQRSMQRLMSTGPAGSRQWRYGSTDSVLTRLRKDETMAGQVKWVMLLKVKKEKEGRNRKDEVRRTGWGSKRRRRVRSVCLRAAVRHLEETKESWRIPEAGRVLRFISFTLSQNYIEAAYISCI